VRRAARLGDAWLVNPHTRLDELDRQMRLYRAERAQRWLPAPAAVPVLREVCVAATDEQAIEIARPHLKDKYDAYVEWGQSDVLPPADTPRREFTEVTAGGRFVLGSLQTCAAILAEHIDRLGAATASAGCNGQACPTPRPQLDAPPRPRCSRNKRTPPTRR
jgi:alkanesulfonate monooxygenase SsuD/methylene tetrahydromethanopterin reductase-like flavin-dependent oxidoreductase (luciferase family)